MTESVQDLKTQKNNDFENKSRESIKGGILAPESHKMGVKMYLESLLILLIITTCSVLFCAFFILKQNRRINQIDKNLAYQYNLMVKIQSILKNKSATNAIAENAEIIYQDLLNNLIPVSAALDIMPRNTSEHPLWRTLGGMLDEYAKNPFVMEKLRRAIKLDSEIKRCVTNYMTHADNLLKHLNSTEPDGILTSTFINGLLGQSLTFFTQAYNLATQENSDI